MNADTGHDRRTVGAETAADRLRREPGRGKHPGLGWRGGPPRLSVGWVGQSLVVSFGTVNAGTAALASTIPAEPDRVAVVMAYSDRALMPYVARKLTPWVPQWWDSVRLVAGYAAVGSENDVPAAQELADLLGIEVLAPDGQLLAVPGGSLFVHGAPDAPRGRWWRFRPGRPPAASGRRFPDPEWEYELSAFIEGGMVGVDAEEIPAGLWLHQPGAGRPANLAFAVPVDRRAVALVVSRPGEPPVPAASVERLIGKMPETLRKRLVPTPYGDEPVADARLGDVASVAANRTLRVRTGLPLHFDGEGSHVFAIGADGTPTWRPFAREMAWRPHGGPRIHRWNPPAEHLLPAAWAQLRLTDRWIVEVVEAGLWIREADRVDAAAAARHLPLTSTYCTVVVSVVDDSPAQPPWRAIVRLLRQLPDDAQDRLRLAVPEAAGRSIVRAAGRACRRVAGVWRVYVLTSDGRLALYDRGPHRGKPRQPREPAPHSPEPAGPPPDAATRAPAGAVANGPVGDDPRPGDRRARPPGAPPVVEVPDLVVGKGGTEYGPAAESGKHGRAARANNEDPKPPDGADDRTDPRRDDRDNRDEKE